MKLDEGERTQLINQSNKKKTRRESGKFVFVPCLTTLPE